MKKSIYSLLASVVLGCIVSGQVGINTPTPQGSFDITYDPTKSPSPQGLLIPKLTGDQIQAMTVGAGQHGMFVFATSKPTGGMPRTNLIAEPGLYYYNLADDKWRNVNQVLNPSSLFSTSYSGANMLVLAYSDNSGTALPDDQLKSSHIIFVNGTEKPFNSSPFVSVRTDDNNRGITFLKSGIYSVTIQFSFIYGRDIAGDSPSRDDLVDRAGSQVTFNLIPNFLTTPTSAYVSNITHATDYTPTRQLSGLFRMSGIAVGNIIVKQDNVVKFIPEVKTSGYWLSADELLIRDSQQNLTNATGDLSIHITRVSDYTP